MIAALIVLGVLVYAGVAGVCLEAVRRRTNWEELECGIFAWFWPIGLLVAGLVVPAQGARKLTAHLLDRPKPPKALPTAKVVQR